MKYSTIAGTGGYLPERVMTNKEFEKIVDTSDEWIRERSGIKRRHIAAEGETTFNEGCLSFPGAQEEVDRAAKVTVRALDQEGNPFELDAEGLLAIAIQHENDHLDGKLMIDHLSILRRRLLHRAMTKRAAADAAQ